jgi:sugar phosphate isomerase/epimerase
MFDIGVMVNNLERDRLRAFRVAADLGFQVVQTNALREAWLTGPERAQYVDAARSSGLRIAAMFVGFDGQSYADLDTIARTVGLLNPELRLHRVAVACRYRDLAAELGVGTLAAHIGFIPADTTHPDYAGLRDAVRQIADCYAERGQTFLLETGQESAVTLVQFLHDVARPNVGVNFDPANFLLYGTDRPLPALQLLAPFVRGVHCKDGYCKDGYWPGRPGHLGVEVPIGKGEVPFPELLGELYRRGYRGPLIIEREHGPTVTADVLAARRYLQELVRPLLSASA